MGLATPTVSIARLLEFVMLASVVFAARRFAGQRGAHFIRGEGSDLLRPGPDPVVYRGRQPHRVDSLFAHLNLALELRLVRNTRWGHRASAAPRRSPCRMQVDRAAVANIGYGTRRRSEKER